MILSSLILLLISWSDNTEMSNSNHCLSSSVFAFSEALKTICHLHVRMQLKRKASVRLRRLHKFKQVKLTATCTNSSSFLETLGNAVGKWAGHGQDQMGFGGWITHMFA